MNIFGFTLKKSKKEHEVVSVVSPSSDDGSAVVTASGYYGMVLDLEAATKNEHDLIRRYRETAQYPDCDSAIEDIVNECITSDAESLPVEIILDDIKFSDSIKKKIRDEFFNVLDLFEFQEKGHDYFRNWYVDGRLHFQILLDENRVKDGIQELRIIEPRKIKKIKEVKVDKHESGADVIVNTDQYYLYNDKGITTTTDTGIKLSVDSVISCYSGLMDQNTGCPIGHLHKAIKPVNQLKMLEDANIIYYISRAPERRIFYIDVGNLPKIKADQYVTEIMNKFRNKIVYDAKTGESRDDRRHLSMMEDFWLPRREGSKGTEISTLQGGQSLAQMTDSIAYFQRKVYQSLNVPTSRMESNTGFNLGRSSEITRDELKFNKFTTRLRKKFSNIFLDALKVQVVSKGIIRIDEWDEIEGDIRFDFLRDNFFTEFKNNEILSQRINMLQLAEPYVGKYYSHIWVRKNILKQTEDDIEEMDKDIEEEKKSGQYDLPTDEEGQDGAFDIKEPTEAEPTNKNSPEAEPEAIPAKPKKDI